MSVSRDAVLLDVRKLTVHYPVRKGLFGRASGQVHAADEVSFAIAEGETLGLVGESGCGKSSTAKAILKLVDPTSGEISWRGESIESLSTARKMASTSRARSVRESRMWILSGSWSEGRIFHRGSSDAPGSW